MSGPSGSAVSAVCGSGTAVSFGCAERLDRVRAPGFDPVLVTEPLAVHGDVLFARRLLAAVDLFLHPLEALVRLPDVPGAEGGQVDMGGQKVPQVLLVRFER